MKTPKHFRRKLYNDTQGAHAHTLTDMQLENCVCGIPNSLNTDKHRHKPTSPDSQSNGVDEVRWKSLYVSVSLSVPALITQQAAQYSSLTFSFCLSVSFYLALSFSLCSTPHQSLINWQSWTEWKRSLVCVWMCVCLHVLVHVSTTLSIWE